MAIVADLSGNGGGTTGSGPEHKLDSVTRVGTAVIGTMTPAFVGELATDTTADVNYRAIGATSADWAVDNS
jgi:hypothetical protein